MRGLKIIPAVAALAAALGQARLPTFRAKAELGPDGTPFDGTRTTSKKTKRLAHLPARFATAHQAKRKGIRASAKKARRNRA